jgi:RHS repeat-associated protein
VANRMSNDGTYTYTYDDAGNTIKKSKGASDETWTYSFDHNNHLTVVEKRATDGGTLLVRVTFTYDARGDRVQEEKWITGVGTTISRFAYDGDRLWVEMDGSSALTMRYLDDGTGLAARITANGTLSGLHADHLGSVRLITDASGASTGTVSYDAFGAILAETSAAITGRFTFTGLRFDRDLELLSADEREYTLNGVWLQEDPILFKAGDANPRRYVSNNPTNATDPTGMYEIVRIPLGNGKFQLNRQAHWWDLAVNGTLYIGILDENTGFVQRGNKYVRVANVEQTADVFIMSKLATTAKWDEWFADNAHDPKESSIVNIMLRENMFAGGTSHSDFVSEMWKVRFLADSVMWQTASAGFLALNGERFVFDAATKQYLNQATGKAATVAEAAQLKKIVDTQAAVNKASRELIASVAAMSGNGAQKVAAFEQGSQLITKTIGVHRYSKFSALGDYSVLVGRSTTGETKVLIISKEGIVYSGTWARNIKEISPGQYSIWDLKSLTQLSR